MQAHSNITANPKPSSSTWTVADVIDFEHLLTQATAPATAPTSPLYAAAGNATATQRSQWFRHWLDHQRQQAEAALPGRIYSQGLTILKLLALLLGFSIGLGLIGKLLAQHAAEPINALLFFAATVGVQLLLVLLLCVSLLLRLARFRSARLGEASIAMIGAAGKLWGRLQGEQRSALQAHWATLDLRSRRLAPLVGTELLALSQLFAVAFNLGLLAAMLLLYLPFVELRFGWQSSYSLGAEGIAAWVQVVSAPWAWISQGLAPGLTEIASSQYTRGQFASSLPAAAAAAWWPFLLAAIACYGLLLRAILLFAFSLLLRRQLDSLTFSQPAAHALWRRWQGPLLRSDGVVAALPAGAEHHSVTRKFASGLLLVDDELAAMLPSALCAAEQQLGLRLAPGASVTTDDDALPAALRDALAAQASSIVLAVPAARDPIIAIAGFIRAVVAAAPQDSDITVLLLGEPQSVGFVLASDQRLEIWRRFVAIQGLAVGVER